jgi:hypothetical protein
MGNLLIHHPWVQVYLLLVGALLLIVFWDHLRHPPPRRTPLPPERWGSCETPPPADSLKNQSGRCQDQHAERIRE